MIKIGIIDPTKVTRYALQNAASVAALMLTTSVMITDIPEEKPEAPDASRRRNGWNVLKKQADSQLLLKRGDNIIPSFFAS